MVLVIEIIIQVDGVGKEEYGRCQVVIVGNGLFGEYKSFGKYFDNLGEVLKGELIQGCVYLWDKLCYVYECFVGGIKGDIFFVVFIQRWYF